MIKWSKHHIPTIIYHQMFNKKTNQICDLGLTDGLVVAGAGAGAGAGWFQNIHSLSLLSICMSKCLSKCHPIINKPINLIYFHFFDQSMV